MAGSIGTGVRAGMNGSDLGTPSGVTAKRGVDARRLAIGLASIRAGAGVFQLAFPSSVSRVFFRHATPASGAAIRLKGVRDATMGLATLALAQRDPVALSRWTAAGAAVDAMDAATVVGDDSGAVRPLVRLAGLGAGLGMAAVGVLAAVGASRR